MSNNLNELNSILFDTLRDLRSHKIDDGEASAVSKLGSTIVSNAKVQLQAVKMMNGQALKTEMFGEIKSKPEKLTGDTFDLKLKFATTLGFKNISEAISKHGNIGFTKLFDEWLKENK